MKSIREMIEWKGLLKRCKRARKKHAIRDGNVPNYDFLLLNNFFMIRSEEAEKVMRESFKKFASCVCVPKQSFTSSNLNCSFNLINFRDKNRSTVLFNLPVWNDQQDNRLKFISFYSIVNWSLSWYVDQRLFHPILHLPFEWTPRILEYALSLFSLLSQRLAG